MKISEMEYGINQAELAFLKIEERTSAKGSRYCNVAISDGEAIVEAKLWSTREDIDFSVPFVVSASIEKQSYNSFTSYIIKEYTPINKDYRKMIPHAPIDNEERLGHIYDVVNQFDDFVLKSIVMNLLKQNKARFIESPAAKTIHHNYAGGLLYHTVRMLEAANKICEVYPVLNKDLLCAGTILHDIGKIYEMEMDVCGNISYTPDGDLLGHVLIGIQMIDRMALKLGIDDSNESLKALKHLVAAHHGKLEYGAIVLPIIPEAMALNQLDALDSRIWQFEKALKPLKPGEFSEKMHGLDDICVYKPEIKN